LEEDDVVLEVGCCGGMTTHLVGRCCPQGMAIGIDQTAAEIAIAKKRFAIEGRVEFYEMDAFDMAAVIKLQKQISRRFNKVLIDINGSRDIGTVHKCLDKLQKTLM
jgi:precorrin-6B methylase 2